MSVETEIFSRLSGFAGLSALVGTRIGPNILPQSTTYPAISYRRVSAERASAMGADPGNVRARFQVDVFAETYASARAVAEQVRQALQRWTNNSGTVIQGTYYLNEVDLYEDETQIHHLALDFEVNYLEE